MNHSGTFTISENKNRLVNIRRIILIFISAVLLVTVIGFVFEHEISVYLSSIIHENYEKSFIFFRDLFRISVFELLWYALLALIFLWIYQKPVFFNALERIERNIVDRQTLFLRGTIVLSALTIIAVSIIVLQQFPNSADEYVYVYQANTLSNGKLWEQAHPVHQSFTFNHIAIKDGISVGRFPIGWPLILAIFMYIGIPAALVNPLLAVVTLIVFYNFSKRLYGIKTAMWSLAVLATSAFFVFNSASFFSHTSCFLETLTFVYCVYNYLQKGKWKYGLFAGLALGLIMLIRYYTAVLLFLPFLILTLYNYREKAIRLFVLIGIGALPCLAAFLYYNYAITGNPLTPVTVWGFKNEGLGFINGHSVANGFEHIIRRIFMFFYWCSPVLLVLYFYFLFKKVKTKSSLVSSPEDYLFITFIIGYFFYYEIGGNQYGPRFYYEAFPFLILFTVNQILKLNLRMAKIALYAALFVMVLKLPFIAYREHEIIDDRQDVYDLVEETGLQNAIVIISTGTCDIRPMPAGDLTRNDHDFKNSVLYAVNNPLYNEALIDFYPDRKIYRYERKPDQKDGKLIRFR